MAESCSGGFRRCVMCLMDEQMWEAVVACDTHYDGQFFYGVQTVGVYCRPSCKSRTPLRKNVRYFQTRDEACNAGFRACKRCRPDLLEYAPVVAIARKTKELIDEYFRERESLAAEMKRLGVTASHLTVIFRQHYGVSPFEYLNRRRAEQAKRMLAETTTPILDIAWEIGFESLPAFYRFFKKQTGETPREYRVFATGV